MANEISKFIPSPLRERGGVWTSLETFLQDEYDYFNEKINSVQHLLTPERTEQPLELTYYTGAYIAINDSIQDIRYKNSIAKRTHKNLPVFSEVYKPIVDKVMGTDSEIVQWPMIPSEFIVAKSLIGNNATIATLNPSASGAKLYGQVFIDIKTIASPAQQQQLIRQLAEIAVIYFKIYVGRSVVITGNPFIIGTSQIADGDVIGPQIANGTYFDIQFAIN